MTDIEIPLGKRKPLYRFFEILPGVLSYLILFAPIGLSLIDPLWGALFVVLFIITWFVKAIGISFRTLQGYGAMQRSKNADWRSLLNDLEDPQTAIARLEDKKRIGKDAEHYRKLKTYIASHALAPSKIYNAVIVATWNESRDVLEPTVKSLIESNYDAKHNLIFILAYEERGGPEVKKRALQLIEDYKDSFFYAVAVEHPNGMKGEIIGKGGNITYAGHYLKSWAHKKGINPERVIVTTLDSDNRPHRNYFAGLTYSYLTTPDPYHKAFQPIAVFTNNIWDVPAPMRVIATGNSFWNIINSQRPHMLRNFAAHSQGLAPLIEMNFWSVRSIVEDGHQFWRSYFCFDGQYEVVPISLPIYQDAVLSEGFGRTLKAQFVQVRRWAYGASDIAYVATRGFRKDRSVPFFDFIGKFARLLDSHVSWATVALITALGAWAPLYFGRHSDKSIIAHQLPIIASWTQRIATIGLVITVFLAWRLLPPRPERYKRHRNIFMLAQWIYMPVTSIAYGSFAAFYSQTRLMLGKYMDKFDVTEKAVKKD
ncbi:MAG TPA: hypothetical protein VLF60_03590 [Candidatus Saccharimonadales bacterium]|nr:hypothetical protein [Candidatus Saccharimonadales bacterium]